MKLAWELNRRLGRDRVVTDPSQRRRLSRDFHWYSPLLAAALRPCVADVVVLPRSEEEVAAVLELAVQSETPVTVRGGGTGNYGQCVPLHGGIVLDMTEMGRVLEIGEGWIRTEAGARLGLVEQVARDAGQELRVMPSTFERSTAAGFICGGAGGIGSVAHGWLWDGNVVSVRALTMEAPPRVVAAQGTDLMGYLHAYGTTGVLTEVTLALTRKTEWTQLVLAFDRFPAAVRFGHALAGHGSCRARLVSVSEVEVTRFFAAGVQWFGGMRGHPALLWVAAEDAGAVLELAGEHGGRLVRELPYGKHPMLSDFSWNHVTLWARKVDPAWTYVQTGFAIERLEEQLAVVRERYGRDVLFHFEYVRSGGTVHLAGLLLLRYRGAEHLHQAMEFLEDIGVAVSNPHTYLLEEGGRRHQRWDAVYRAKAAHDPADRLNPGKLRGPLEG
ncbi:MAG TPA: FAD-binding oxidoreductase [Dehalococcoidia bacterium]